MAAKKAVVPFAMTGAQAIRPLTEDEIQRVAGGTKTAHFPQGEGGEIKYDDD